MDVNLIGLIAANLGLISILKDNSSLIPYLLLVVALLMLLGSWRFVWVPNQRKKDTSNTIDIKTSKLPDGRSYQLSLNIEGQLFERWKMTPDSHSGWTKWSYFLPMPPGVRKLKRINDVHPLSDGRLQQWVTDDNEQAWSCWKENLDSNSGWTLWSRDSSPP